MQVGEVDDVTFTQCDPVSVEIHHPVSILDGTGGDEVEGGKVDVER